ncbi:MAG: type II toxin-antitoxin system Phd/YefM family antitoxin [Pseudomonadota bacterium]
MQSWQLQEAKAHFSKVVKEAILKGPQDITVRGEPAVVILSWADYKKLQKTKPSLVEFMRQSPLVGISLNLSRDQSMYYLN